MKLNLEKIVLKIFGLTEEYKTENKKIIEEIAECVGYVECESEYDQSRMIFELKDGKRLESPYFYLSSDPNTYVKIGDRVLVKYRQEDSVTYDYKWFNFDEKVETGRATIFCVLKTKEIYKKAT